VARNILTVDVGNSRAKFGYFELDGSRVEAKSITAISLRTHRDVAGKLADWAREFQVDSCVIAGSNEPVAERLATDWSSDLPSPAMLRRPQSIPVTLNVDQPDAVGIDRVLNALAAHHLFPDRAVVVVDSGTATTVDLVSESGTFEGGTIFPGLRLSAYALHDYTDKLPLIDVDAIRNNDPSVPGRNTEEAIRAGLYWGQVGAIREIVQRIATSYKPAAQTIVTGGALNQLQLHLPESVGVEGLPLLGLAVMADSI